MNAKASVEARRGGKSRICLPPAASPVSRMTAVSLVIAHVALSLTIYCSVPYWFGQHKTYLLASYVLLFLPACLFLWRASTGSTGPQSSGLPSFWSLPMLIVVCAVALVGYAAAFNTGNELSDESVYRFESRALNSGQLGVASPPEHVLEDRDGRQAFRFTHELHVNGRWFGKYPIGFPSLLAVAETIGIGRFINPLLSVGIVCLSAWLAHSIFGTAVAAWTIVVLALSPFFILNSIGWYSHNLAALLIVAATASCVRSTRSRPVLFLILASVAIGLCIFVRPFTAALAAVVLSVYALLKHARNRRVISIAGIMAVIVVCTVVTGYLYVQKQLTGHWLVSPYAMYYNAGGVIPKEINVSPASILRNLAIITGPALADTMLSAAPLVLPLALVACFLWWRSKEPAFPEATLLSALFWIMVAGYSVQTESSTSTVGERYYFEGYFAAVIVAVATFDHLMRRHILRTWPWRTVAICLLSVSIIHFVIYHKISFDSRQPYAAMQQAALAVRASNAIIYLEDAGPHFFGSWLNLNGASWRTAPVLYLHDPGPEGRGRVARLLGRDTWMLLRWDTAMRKAVTVITEKATH